MALTIEQLEGYDTEVLKKSLIEYSVALDKSNADLTSYVAAYNTATSKITELNETIEKLQTTIDSKTSEISKLEEEIQNNKIAITELKQASTNDDECKKTVEQLIKTNNELKEELNKKELSLCATNESAKLTIDNLQAEIVKLKNLIELSHAVANTTPDTIIKTYTIYGFDTTSEKNYPGALKYPKVNVIVKLDKETLTWEAKSTKMKFAIKGKRTLTPEELEYLTIESATISWFDTLKKFLEIPDTVEKDFSSSLVFLNKKYIIE